MRFRIRAKMGEVLKKLLESKFWRALGHIFRLKTIGDIFGWWTTAGWAKAVSMVLGVIASGFYWLWNGPKWAIPIILPASIAACASVIRALIPSAYTEEILFDSRKGLSLSDIRGRPGQLWRRDGSTAPKKGEGTLRVENGALNLRRSNIDERYELHLERYLYKGKEYDAIPEDDFISGNRELHVRCEVKANAEHTLRFTIRDLAGAPAHGSVDKYEQITSNYWRELDLSFMIEPHLDIRLGIFDQDVSRAPSSVQLRNLVVTQKK
jgi:hypothetical protein